MTVGPGGRLLWIVQIKEILFESCWKNIVIGPLLNAKQFIIYASSPELSGSLLETWQISETFFCFQVLYNKVLAAFLCIFHYCKRLCYNDAHSDFVTNIYGESWESSCEKSLVPVQKQQKKSVSPKLNMFCNLTVNLKTDSNDLYYLSLKLKYTTIKALFKACAYIFSYYVLGTCTRMFKGTDYSYKELQSCIVFSQNWLYFQFI